METSLRKDDLLVIREHGGQQTIVSVHPWDHGKGTMLAVEEAAELFAHSGIKHVVAEVKLVYR
jgi:hypothetical protein